MTPEDHYQAALIWLNDAADPACFNQEHAAEIARLHLYAAQVSDMLDRRKPNQVTLREGNSQRMAEDITRTLKEAH